MLECTSEQENLARPVCTSENQKNNKRVLQFQFRSQLQLHVPTVTPVLSLAARYAWWPVAGLRLL